MKNSNRPLSDLVVIDSTCNDGELGSRLLADLGASVIKVEPPGGAPSRGNGPFSPDGTSLWFAYRNANKSSEAVDLTTPAGRARLDELLAAADIWFDSSAPGALRDHGFEPAAVLERHPRLAVVTVTPFGYTGPYRDFQATDLVCNALSGMLYKGGIVAEPPLAAPGTFCSDVASVTAAFAALAAHRQASLTGRGQHVDLSLQEAVAQITDWGMPNGSTMKLLGFDYPRVRAGSGPAYPIFPCADGYVRLIVLSPPAWKEMRAWLGNPEWLDDPSYDSLVGRILVEDVLGLLYRELFADRTKMELAHEAQGRGIALTPVLSLREAMDSEHAVARGSFPLTDISSTVRGRAPAGFFAIDGERCGPRTPCPEPGAGAPAPGERRAAFATGDVTRPLEGIRVLDFGIGGVGVEAGRMLADYGADVIKVETRTYPDFIRVLGGTEMSASFASSNRNKRSFGVNAKTEDGRNVLCRLIETADVLIENGSVGAMDSIGLGYDRLREINPALVIVSSQLMGSSGPWSSWMGYGPSSRTVAGLTWLWNYPGHDEPTESAAIHPDHVCGRLVAVAALAGLHGRIATGTGCHAEVTQYEAVTAMLGEFFLGEDLQPGSVQPSGNRSGQHAPWGVYPCAGDERWCVICVRSDGEWLQLVEALGRPDWALDPQLRTAEARLAHREEIDTRLSGWTSERSDTEVMELLQAAGVPAGRLVDSLELSSDPQLSYRGFPQVIDQPGLGDVWLEGPAFHASGMPDPEVRPAPGLGAHTRELCEELGLSAGEIDALVAAGALDEDLAG